jgi:hypothetical protein
MADPRDDNMDDIMMNMIRGGDEQVRYDDRECDENPQGIDDGSQYLALEGVPEAGQVCNMQPSMFIYMKFKIISSINCLVYAYIALWLDDNHQKSIRIIAAKNKLKTYIIENQNQ